MWIHFHIFNIQRKKKEMQKKLQNAKNQSMKSFSKKEPKYKTNYEKKTTKC